MRRIQRSAETSSPLERLLQRAPRGLRDLFASSPKAPAGDVQELVISARKFGPVLQVDVANTSRVFLSSIEVALLIEFYDVDHTANELRDVEFLSPGEQVLLAVAVESDRVSRVWCTTNYTLRGDRHSATGGVELG